MKLGVALPLIDSDVGGSPAAIQEFAQTAEETGYRDVSAPDHVLGVNVASRPDWGDRNTPAGRSTIRSYCLAFPMPPVQRAYGMSPPTDATQLTITSGPCRNSRPRKAGVAHRPPTQEEMTLKRFIAPAGFAAVIAAGLSGQAVAQGAPATVSLMKVDQN